ncbi:peptidase T, partial [Candidatus Bipolaricaulota bacterium]|nr:peptidase T [Candidatus Bipolaricaulota bacterium]
MNVLEQLEKRFVRYAAIDTQSADGMPDTPSTEKQLDLQRLLVQELSDLGASDVRLTEHGFTMATIPATVEDAPTVAFLAHVDTALDYAADNVKPIVHRNYDGKPIVLPGDASQILDDTTAPELKDKVGDTIITSDGTTLLGADDKAGVAIIITMAEKMLADPAIPHGPIRVCFTPDEEIGTGIGELSLEDLNADVAYTLDGETLGEVTFESFSADKAVVTITGVSIHPGKAKGRLVNALTLAARLLTLLPQDTRTPETSDGREGFIHLTRMEGSSFRAELHFILRDFERAGLESHRETLRVAIETIQKLEPRAHLEIEITKQYRNMRYWLENDMRPAELAIEAVRLAGIEPSSAPIRGGTDGAQLTERGLPTPNLFASIHNAHGPLEWTSIQEMNAALDMCLHLSQLWSK